MRNSLVTAAAVAAALAFGLATFQASAAEDAKKACAKIKDKAEKAECLKKAGDKKK